MKSSQYDKILKYTDEIIYSNIDNYFLISNPWLHVIREHPVFLKHYEFLFSNSFLFTWKIIKISCINILSILYSISRSFISSDFHSWVLQVGKLTQFQFLFISQFVSDSPSYVNDDFIFGNLDEKVSEGGSSTLTLLFNFTRTFRYNFFLKNENKNSKLLMPRFCSFKIELLHSFNLLLASLNLLKNLFSEKDVLKKRIYLCASIYCLSEHTLNCLRKAYLVLQILKHCDSKHVITTFEGHSWERLIFYQAHLNTNCLCFAYIHSPLFKNQHSIFRHLSKSYDPDVFLFAGEIIQNMFLTKCSFDNFDSYVLGSNRNFKIDDVIRKKRRFVSSADKACLVLCEGINSEAKSLLLISLDCAIHYPNLKFIWRLHPLLSFNDLFSHDEIEKLPSNIFISERSFDLDISSSDYALYRGSSSIIQAIAGGLRPIYFKKANEMSIDPLFFINDWRIQVTNTTDLADCLENEIIYDFSFEETIEQIKKIYEPFDSQVLLKFIDI